MSETQTGEWRRYGSALIEAMREVLEEADESHRELLLETADYWLTLGLAIGLQRSEQAHMLLDVTHADEERAELLADADDLLTRAL